MAATNRCMVVGCDQEGHPQVCPFDQRYHHHGRIHYTNDHGYPELFGFRFEELAVAGWGDICNAHHAAIKEALEARRIERALAL